MSTAASAETSSRPSAARLYTLIVLMTVFWSGNYIAGKFALREMPGPLLATLRITLAAALIAPFWPLITPQERQARRPGDLWKLTALGVLGVTMNQIFFVIGLGKTSVAHAAILVGLTPILVLFIAALIGQERITPQKALGMVIALAGVAVLQVPRATGSEATLRGDLIVFCGALVFAMYTVFGKPVAARLGATAITVSAYISGAIVIAPLTLWLARGFRFGAVTPGAWLSLLYMAAIASAAAYLIYAWALKFVPASRVAAFSYLQPVLATLMAIPLLNERLTASLVAGGALALAGVAITERG